MNSKAAPEYNSFSLLANLENNKVICQASSVHFGPTFLTSPRLSPLSFSPPLSKTAAAAPSTNKASNLH
jgi:hypothetical protein